jgi:uncharacterized membrane protein YqjE
MADDTSALTPVPRETRVPGVTPVPRETEEWPDRAADLLEYTVGAVQTKTVVPLIKVAQLLIYILLLATTALAIALLLVIALVRLVILYIPVHPHARAVWVTYAGLGAIFVIAGVFFVRKRPREVLGREAPALGQTTQE